jgi:hypothetical protein
MLTPDRSRLRPYDGFGDAHERARRAVPLREIPYVEKARLVFAVEDKVGEG